MRLRTYLIALGFMLAVAAGWIRYCSGPQPRVTETELVPPEAPGAPFLVRFELTNGFIGEGDVTVRILLKSPSGKIYQQLHRVELTPRGTTRALVPVFAPEGSTLVNVTAQYPPG